MLFLVIAIAAVLAITVVTIMAVKGFNFDWHPGVFMSSILIITSLVITVIVMTICISYSHITADAYATKMEQQYDNLTYQLKNNMYDNDNEYGKKELYNQIQSWNEELAYGKTMQDNFWLGIFYPHVYDRFAFIELPEK